MKTRFAPSPTGLIHFGNLRTALFNFLLAKSQKGDFLLRIEDTDQERSKKEYVDALLEDLDSMLVKHTEGPKYQAGRVDTYNKYYSLLEEKGLAYPCFCSEQKLAMMRKAQLSAGAPPRYSGACRNLSKEEIAEKLSEGQNPVLRFKIEKNKSIEFEDLIKGKQKFASDDIGDFIIRRADKTASFMFANAIDDSLMGVTHALRGDDHLTNTPRQVAILRSLELREPLYGHFPLIYGMDGAPLSKRNGSAAVKDLLDEGYLPIALLNYLARLGHYYSNNEFLSLDKLAELFDLKNVNTAPAKHDISHLKHWQKESIMRESNKDLWNIINHRFDLLVETYKNLASNLSSGNKPNNPQLEESALFMDKNINSFKKIKEEGKQEEFVDLIKPNILMPQEAMTWARALFSDELEYSDGAKKIISNAGPEFFKCALDVVENKPDSEFSEISSAVKEKLGVKGKNLFKPLRIALTGEENGPEMPKIVKVLGSERVIARFKQALDR